MNRDASINTFEGGIDLDSDIRLVQPNKMRDAVNVDIRRSEDVAVLVDIKGEEIKATLEDLNDINEAHILASTNETFFLIEPTSEKKDAIVVFYTRRKGSLREFVISAFFIEDNILREIYKEQLSEEDYNTLQDSSIDFVKVGQFGYDTIYFVDNRRQPRVLECLIDRLNDVELILLFDIIDDVGDFKIVNLNLVAIGGQTMPFRAYVYAYKLGGPMRPNTINPNTTTIRFVDFTGQDNTSIPFFIYEEDYGTWIFEIVYHREGNVFYRNFIIGDPFQVVVPVGVLTNSAQLIASTSLTPSPDQLNSWNFLYEGAVLTVFKDDNTSDFQTGTRLYVSEIGSPANYLPSGFYQVADENTFVQVDNGVIVDVNTNNWNVTFSTNDPDVLTEVITNAVTITDGVRDRLTVLEYDIPKTVEVGGNEFEFISISAGTKSSTSNEWSFTLERPDEVNVVATYLPSEFTVTALMTSVISTGPGSYDITFRANLNRPLSEDIFVNIQARAFDDVTNDELLPAEGSVFIGSGDLFGEVTITYTVPSGEAYFNSPCVDSFTYTGPETITPTNPCVI